MIIGCGLLDRYINQALTATAAAGRGFKIFVIHPLGVEVMRAPLERRPFQMLGSHSLEGHIIGASRLALAQIFGLDCVQRRKFRSSFHSDATFPPLPTRFRSTPAAANRPRDRDPWAPHAAPGWAHPPPRRLRRCRRASRAKAKPRGPGRVRQASLNPVRTHPRPGQGCPTSDPRSASSADHVVSDHSRSKRSRFITLVQAATKSCTNFAPASALA